MVPGSRYNSTNPFVRAFPPPEYLTQPAVGIDISDYAVKHIRLGRKWPHFYLDSHGKVELPLGVVEGGEVKDVESLVKHLGRVREEYGYIYAHLSLPEEHAFLFQMELEDARRSDMDQMVEFHLRENVPLGPDEAVYDYTLTPTTTHTYRANVAVYPAAIAQAYVEAMDAAGFITLSVELEGQATARALLSHTNLEPTLIVDIGRNQASLSMSVDGEVTFTANLESGGDNFTRAIARALDVSFQEAERLKRQYGFRDVSESASVYKGLRPLVVELAKEIQKHFVYWQMHAGTDVAHDVSRVILVGGNANMAGLAEYLEAALEVPVVVGNVWTNVFSFQENLPTMHYNESLEFATAVGLALRSIIRSG